MAKKKQITRMQVFALSSLVLALGGVWAVLVDSFPQWKTYQMEYDQIMLARAEKTIASENERVEIKYSDRLAELDARIRVATDASRSVNQQELIAAKEAEIFDLTQKNYEASTAVSFAKSELGAFRSKYEFLKNDHHATPAEVEAAKKDFDRLFADVQRLQPPADEVYIALEHAKLELKDLQKGPADIVRDRDVILAERDKWRAEAERISPSTLVGFTASAVRDIPLLDFINPKYNLKQIVLNDLPDITQSAKVDRCITCHLGIENPDLQGADVEAVYRAHPKLDLFVGRNSPHPVEKFGCTTCHLGRGYGTTFRTSGHTPNDKEQATEWKKKYGWKEHDMHYWDYPMLPERNQEAMCVSCHPSTQEVRMAETVFKGRQIYERRGCHGCHKIEGVSDELKKVGPTLKKIAAKLDPDWTAKWIESPRNFYPDTNMPHPFGHQVPSKETFPEFVEHTEHELGHGHFDKDYEVMKREEAVMIDSISEWMFTTNDNEFLAQMEEPPAEAGNAEEGKRLVGVINCLGCHKLDDFKAAGQGYAPDLSKVGSKTNRKWLWNWLKDPNKYWPDGKMPNPRLSETEINDVTEYLLTLKDEEFDAKPRPTGDASTLEEIALRYKRTKLPEEAAKAEVAAMSEQDRKLFVGEESMYRRGCFSCHEVKGYEDRARIGAELTAEGFKEIELFDFGMHKYIHIPHFRHDWVEQKVKQPFGYFLGKVMNPYEQVFYMPWFGFDDEEASAIATYILGQTGKIPPAKYRYEMSGTKDEIVAKQAMIRGAKEIERRNCIGCHPVGLGWNYRDAKEVAGAPGYNWLSDPLVALHDPNLPEGKFAKLAQVPEEEIKLHPETGETLDKILVPEEGFLVRSNQVIFGEDYLGMEDLLGEEPVAVDIGAKDEVRIALERPEKLRAYGENEAHIAQFYPDIAMAPPVLRRQGAKTNPDWFFGFLKNVRTVRNHIEVRMPQWEWTDQEANDVVHYFAVAAGEKFPFETVDVPELGPQHVETAKSSFGLPGTPEYDLSLKCLSCHPTGDLMPTNPKESWGPDLYLAHDRLKLSFIESWITNPTAWSPGTKMPNFFYDKDGDIVIEIIPDSPKKIRDLAEMLYYLPEIDEVKVAAALAAEAAAARAAQQPAEEEFMEDGDAPASGDEEFMDEEEEFLEEGDAAAAPAEEEEVEFTN